MSAFKAAPSDTQPTLNRRTAFVGAGAVGVLAASAALLHKGPAGAAIEQQALAPAAEPEGYRLTEHIKQYYASARI